jgi:exosortase/archaeosortase family protein
MSIGTISYLQTVNDWTSELRHRWQAMTATAQLRIRVAILLVAVVCAYHYSLSSLLQTISFDTPLAYIGLVPIIAAGLAVAIGHQAPPEPAIHDRQLDYIIGVPLIALAVAINEILPERQSVLFWMRRMDLVSLPLFVAGAVAILFGTRTLWRQKIPILYLFLAWPWPYTTILLGTLDGLFSVFHHGHPFPVSVVTACSGVDGMVGFVLVGAAFAAIVHGPWLRKALWLVTGFALLWITNLGRLVLIFWAGGNWGEHAAIDILHPIAGLIIFNIGVVVMMLLLRPFGLNLGRRPERGSGSGPKRPPGDKPQPVFLAAGILIILGLLLYSNNNSFKAYNLIAGASGNPRLSSYLVDPAAPAGWTPEYTTEYTSNKSLFGESSRWIRYTYFYHGGGDLSATLPVTADVINSANVQSFGAYGVEACYNFHGYTLRDIGRVSLGDGITGETMSFSTGSNGDWSIVYWIWPVKTGTQTRYERIILYLQDTQIGQVKPPANVPGVSGFQGALSAGSAVDKRLIVNRLFLVGFAREVITDQSRVVEDSTNIGQVDPRLSLSAVSLSPGNSPQASAGKSTPQPWLTKLRAAQKAYWAKHG